MIRKLVDTARHVEFFDVGLAVLGLTTVVGIAHSLASLAALPSILCQLAGIAP